jgi:acyl dehydratase
MTRQLPGGAYTIPAGEEPRLDAIIGGDAGPLWAFLAATGGLGVSIAELFALVDCNMADGPMLGEWEVEFARPLEAGREYRVTATILGVDRKEGRSGTFDLMRVRAEVGDAAACTIAYVVPR